MTHHVIERVREDPMASTNAKKTAKRAAPKSRKTSKNKKKVAAKKPARKAARKPAKRSRRKAAQERWLRGRLPAGLERVDLVVKAVERGEDEVVAAVERLQGAYQDLAGRVDDLEQQARDGAERRVEDIIGRVRETRAGGALEQLEQLPDRAVEELDELLDRMGLVRKAKYDEDLAKAKKRGQAAGRRAAKREMKKLSEAGAEA
jgi:hypothetical protein